MKVKLFAVTAITACSALCATTGYGQDLKNGNDSLSYAFGVLFGHTIQTGGFQNINAEVFTQVVRKVISGEELSMSPEDASAIVNRKYQEMQQLKVKANLEKGQAFLNSNKNAPGVVTLPSGLQYRVLIAGTGAKPMVEDRVTVHYHGTLIDGTVFDSSVDRGEPVELGVNQVIGGWQEALQLMPAGSKWMLYIPSELAYGESAPSAQIPPNSVLIFEIELISISH